MRRAPRRELRLQQPQTRWASRSAHPRSRAWRRRHSLRRSLRHAAPSQRQCAPLPCASLHRAQCAARARSCSPPRPRRSVAAAPSLWASRARRSWCGARRTVRRVYLRALGAQRSVDAPRTAHSAALLAIRCRSDVLRRQGTARRTVRGQRSCPLLPRSRAVARRLDLHTLRRDRAASGEHGAPSAARVSLDAAPDRAPRVDRPLLATRRASSRPRSTSTALDPLRGCRPPRIWAAHHALTESSSQTDAPEMDAAEPRAASTELNPLRGHRSTRVRRSSRVAPAP